MKPPGFESFSDHLLAIRDEDGKPFSGNMRYSHLRAPPSSPFSSFHSFHSKAESRGSSDDIPIQENSKKLEMTMSSVT